MDRKDYLNDLSHYEQYCNYDEGFCDYFMELDNSIVRGGICARYEIFLIEDGNGYKNPNGCDYPALKKAEGLYKILAMENIELQKRIELFESPQFIPVNHGMND